MLFRSVLVSLPSAAYAWTAASSVLTDLTVGESMLDLFITAADGNLETYLATEGVTQTCEPGNVAIRKDYTSLSSAEKLDYISAINCLLASPSLTPSVSAPLITTLRFPLLCFSFDTCD